MENVEKDTLRVDNRDAIKISLILAQAFGCALMLRHSNTGAN